jgi:hypothetical protein
VNARQRHEAGEPRVPTDTPAVTASPSRAGAREPLDHGLPHKVVIGAATSVRRGVRGAARVVCAGCATRAAEHTCCPISPDEICTPAWLILTSSVSPVDNISDQMHPICWESAEMARQPSPNPYRSPTPAAWSLLLPSWAAAPDSRSRPSSTLATAMLRVLRVLRDQGRHV